jgi:hypothetical protein
VIGTIRSSGEEAIAETAGAYEVVSNNEQLTASVRDLHQTGIDHSVEVAFGAKNRSRSRAAEYGWIYRHRHPFLADGVQEYPTILSRK